MSKEGLFGKFGLRILTGVVSRHVASFLGGLAELDFI